MLILFFFKNKHDMNGSQGRTQITSSTDLTNCMCTKHTPVLVGSLKD